MNDRKAFKWIMVLSIVVFAAIVVLYSLPKQQNIPDWAKMLPTLNALINGTCSALLVVSFISIKNKRVQLHKRLNIATFVLSCVFLLSYVVFHSFGVETAFPKDNSMRPFYLVILLSHILLAAIVLPLVLISFYLGLTGNTEKHRKVSRFSFPVWLYVTVTGVIVYLMISPYYSF
ncbi:DUF420 domain-containing protein [Bacteroidota bacterium]